MKRAFTFLLVLVGATLCLSSHRPQIASSQTTSAAATTEQLAGLREAVTIRRDERGIPYIEARNDDDLYFAQGYITASDRLWQMDLQRRTARGELAEIFGQAALTQDKLHRTFGFGRMIDEAAAHLDPKFGAALTAYANGINAYISSRTDQTLPPEFRILQYKPRPWSPADSLAVGALMAEYLSSTWQLDVMRGGLMSLPKNKREAVLPDTSPLDVLVVGSDRTRARGNSPTYRGPRAGSPRGAVDRDGVTEFPPAILAELNELIEAQRVSFERLGFPARGLETLEASNNWVVSGKHTATGKPLLANDPHIPASAPNIWYQTELMAPGIHVAGVTFPGLPGLVIGHNERIAWGATNLGPDVQDVYIEKFDKTNPTRYQTPSGWSDAEVRHEQIKVRKSFTDSATDTQTHDVVVTRHGPIILEKDGTSYALRWTLLDPATLQTAGIFNVNRASNWKEFTQALSSYQGPTQNFIYADVDGHIGYYGAGRIPIRKSGDGSVPYDGATDDGEWTGFVPFDKLPHISDPASGIIVTANQRVVGSDYPYFVSHVWASPLRARRIFDLLSAKPKLSIDDFRRIQSDVYSIGNVTFARAAAKILKAQPTADTSGAQFVKDLESWDGLMTADSRTAVIVSQMRAAFRQRIIGAALGPDLAKTYGWPESDVLMDRLLAEQPREWLPKDFATYADLLKATYQDARDTLTRNLGADDSKWSWGAQTKVRFQHPLAQAPLIGVQFAIPPFPQNGTGGLGATVNVGSSVSMRFIADVSDWDQSQNGIPLGESGWPNNPHWKDQLDDWRNVTPRAFPFSKTAVATATKETLVLTPRQ